jgi:hypothetical protein
MDADLPKRNHNARETVYDVKQLEIVYGTTMTAFYQFHRNDKCQDHFLAGAVVAATTLSWLCGRSIRAILMDILPTCIVMSLILSAVFQKVMSKQLAWRRIDVEPQEDQLPK